MTSPVLLVVHPDDRTPEVSSSWGHFRAFPSELGAKEAWIHPAKPAPLYPPTQFWLPASQIPENEINKDTNIFCPPYLANPRLGKNLQTIN